ncbi:hypothetical protein [Motilibacter deserti]|uniref:Secreted protein n=1 Tax=Motilibacter deserti TaxID=2714956 RepID=A0ABX0GXI1_9ACTN|nr:hypothetical protein [Motilibacter deserti]NHC15686.1 hypothetical protein [Motilibacter deserti]
MNRTARTAAAAALVGGALLAPSASASAATAPEDLSKAYMVQVLNVHAVDETGPDWFGQDEIYAGFRVTYPRGSTAETQTAKFGMDTGDTRTIAADQSCLSHPMPTVNTGRPWLSALDGDTWTCHQYALHAPFSVTSHVWEEEGRWSPFTAASSLGATSPDDQSLGRVTTSFSQEGLDADLRFPGWTKNYVVDHRKDGAHYRITVRVFRTK